MIFACSRFSSNVAIQRAGENNPPLKRGASGEAVRILQLGLIDLGINMPGSTRRNTALPDGIFGPETEQVVKAFQRSNGLLSDGMVGPQTLARLDTLLDTRSNAVAALDRALGKKGRGRS